MKNFRLIKRDIDTLPLLQELRRFPHSWSTKRASKISYHRETVSIPLRGPMLLPGASSNDQKRVQQTEYSRYFPRLNHFLQICTGEIGGQLGRVNIVSLKPGGKVYPHQDPKVEDGYYQQHDRYHLVLQSPLGSYMECGGEKAIWREGEIWWFNNLLPHEAINSSLNVPRIHVIFDIRRLSSLSRWWAKIWPRAEL